MNSVSDVDNNNAAEVDGNNAVDPEPNLDLVSNLKDHNTQQ